MKKKMAIIDSGIGGTSLLGEILSRELSCEIYYQADSKNVPYGEKSQEFMLERMRTMIDLLPPVEAIIIACNTLTVETINILRQGSTVELFGVEPFIKYIHKANLEEKVGLILTPATYRSQRLKNLIELYDCENKITIIPLVKLALLIEDYRHINWEEIKTELNPVKDAKLDKLILGCTHYPLIKPFIEAYLGLETIDPNPAVVNHIVSSLKLESGESSVFYRFNLDEKWKENLELPLIDSKGVKL
ncbi:MAG: glutamate racemase [Halobacteriovoraceae bacterium]|nr:glutamate racemase [Halobacteriovoraceae bacterium]